MAGRRFEGQWQDGQWPTRGRVYYSDGNRYEGQFGQDGSPHGQGTMYFANGNRYEGQWQDNRKQGYGTHFWGPNSESAGHRYEGQWQDDRKHGQGTYYWPDGNRYEGQYINGLAAGGQFTWADGTTTMSHQNPDGSWVDQ